VSEERDEELRFDVSAAETRDRGSAMSRFRSTMLAGLLAAAIIIPATGLTIEGLRELGSTGSYARSSAPADTTAGPADTATTAADTETGATVDTTSEAATTSATDEGSTAPTPSPGLPSDPVPAGSIGPERQWRLAFADEFDGDELDTTSWARCYWWAESGCTNASNNEQQWYVPEGVQVSDGTLRLTAQRQAAVGADGERFEYTSGIVTGLGNDGPRRPFTYGYFEMRGRIPSGRGLWPAFWMLPASKAPAPEVDIMEALGQDPTSTLMYFHWPDADGTEQSTGQWWTDTDMSLGWHTYAVHWERDRLTWYIDGVARLELTDEQVAVPAEPMYLLANLAVGGDFATAPDAETVFPATFEIDYVRVWDEP
jgi:beta-glucanase (GH16 family)